MSTWRFVSYWLLQLIALLLIVGLIATYYAVDRIPFAVCVWAACQVLLCPTEIRQFIAQYLAGNRKGKSS